MNASDIAYLTALVEKSPSSYRRRDQLIEELQHIYQVTQGGKYGDHYRVPVAPYVGIMEIDRS